eukprot:gene11957-12046_t
MIKKLIALLAFYGIAVVHAQTIKTDVLVIGNGSSAVAAAIQCGRSKVKTIVAFSGIKINNGEPGDRYNIQTNRYIPSGIWGEFRKNVQHAHPIANPDTMLKADLSIEPVEGALILRKMMDTVKNLTLYDQTLLSGIKKDDDRWSVSLLQNGKAITVKARVVIDASQNAEVLAKANAKVVSNGNLKNYDGTNFYRTSIAAGDNLPGLAGKAYPETPSWSIPVKAVVAVDAENLLVTESLFPDDLSMQYLPAQLAVGQGAGTVAAYCAFFKTTTKNLKVRIIQGELLDFKGYLLPFTDISPTDADWRAIQQVCATGLLKGSEENRIHFVFMPDTLVNTVEIKPLLTEIYTRAFLWFNKEKPAAIFTVGNMLSFISDYSLTDPEVLQKSVQRAWKTKYKFKYDFEPKRPITRREFAVLANHYLNPFARTVDLNGRLVN